MYWIVISVCLGAATGTACEERLLPQPVESLDACRYTIAGMMRLDNRYRHPSRCVSVKPDLPELASPIPPGRWA